MSTCDISDFLSNVRIISMMRPLEDDELDLIGQVLMREQEYWLSDDEVITLCGMLLWNEVEDEQ